MTTRSKRLPYEGMPSSSSSQHTLDTIQATPHQTFQDITSSPTSSHGALFSNTFKQDLILSAPSSQQGSLLSSYSTEAASTPSSSCDQQKKKIPRPPNAWILYRSAKVKIKDKDDNVGWNCPQPWNEGDLPTPSSSTSNSSKSPLHSKQAIGQRAVRYQSAMSKRVADMWKAESEEVKNQYYELAKRKKEEHEHMYPGYKYRPAPKGPGSKAKVEKDGTVEFGDIDKKQRKKCKASKQIEGQRPASTAKTKGKGPPDLFIDVDAAEKQTPFSSIVDLPFSAILGKPSKDDPSSSYFGLGSDALDEATMVVDRLLQQKIFIKEESPTTSGLASIKSSKWIASPLPLTPADSEQTAAGNNTIIEPWTAWIMDNPSSAEPATPINTRDRSILSAPLTEPPPVGKNKKAKKTNIAKTDSKVRNTARRKSTSNAGIKQHSTLSRAAAGTAPLFSGGAATSQKKFKRAFMNKEYVKAVESKNKASPVKEKEADGSLKNQIAVEHISSNEAITLNILLQSYDRDGVDSEVEEALLCADTLIESFANMAAWSPDQGWFTGIPQSAPAIVVPTQDTYTLSASSWTLYSQPVKEGQGLDGLDTEMFDRLQCDIQEAPLMPQIMEPSSFAPSLDMDDVMLTASRRLAEWDQMNDNQANNLDLPINIIDENWTLNEQEWDTLLTQAILDPSFNQPNEQRTSAMTGNNALDTPPDSVWDLIHFDSLSQGCGTESVDCKSFCGDSARSTSGAMPSDSPSNLIKEERPVIELHGTYTEEELREKLRQLTRSSQ